MDHDDESARRMRNSRPMSCALLMFTPGGAYAQQPLADIAAARKVRIVLRLQRTKWGVMT